MTKYHWLVLVATFSVFGLLVFWPHLSYPFPFHIDEWHHLTEAKRLVNPANYFNWLQAVPGRATVGLEIGFQFWLLLLSRIFNIISIYKFLPALWAVFSGATLFFVAYQKSTKNFLVAWLSLVFFMAIRTNTNLTGLWFFTPLSFSFPFIFLYTYFISEGILAKSKKLLFSGFLIMLGLLFCHPLSVLFSFPILAIFIAINYRDALKEKWLWLFLPIIFLGGVGFFSLVFGINPIVAMGKIFSLLKFSRGWGVLELNNSIFELYPWLAWFWAIIGFSYLLSQDQNIRRYSFYLLWPIVLLSSTLLYRLIGVSFFSPFQRNLYYLTLALPNLSGYGLYYFTQKTLPKWLASWSNPPQSGRGIQTSRADKTAQLIGGGLIVVTFLIVFWGYYELPTTSRLYKIITVDDYKTIQLLAQKPPIIIMSTPPIGTALTALTNNEPVGSINFYGDRKIVESFYLKSNCQQKKKILDSVGATLVYWPTSIKPLDCSWGKLLRQSRDSQLFTIIETK